MGSIRDRRTGRVYEVSDADAVRYAREDPNLEVVGNVPIGPGISFSGEAVARDPNARVISPQELNEHYHGAHEAEVHDTLGSRAKAFVHGAVGTLDFGVWKPFGEDADAHPGYSSAGGLAALIPAFLYGAGEEAVGAKAAGVAADALAAERAAGGIAEVANVARGAGTTARTAYSWTAPGIATRIGAAAERLVPETIAGSRLAGATARTAIGGAAFGGSDELLHQALDSDAEFSGERLVSAATLGGLLGAGGHLAAEGIEAGGRALSRLRGGATEAEALSSTERSALLDRTRPPEAPQLGQETHAPWRERVDLTRSPGEVRLADAMTNTIRDYETLSRQAQRLIENPAIAEAAGVDLNRVRLLVGDVNKVPRLIDRMGTYADQPVQRLSQFMHAGDELAEVLRPVTDRLPARWAEDARRLATERDIAARVTAATERGAGPDVLAAEHVAARLASGLSSTESEAVRGGLLSTLGKGVMGKVLSKVPGGSLLKGALGVAAGGYVLDHLIDHSVAHMLRHGAIGVAAATVGGRLGARALRAAFSDPAVGGLVAGTAAHVLSRANLLPGDRTGDTTDPRRALRDFADRTRRITPEAVAGHAVGTLGSTAGAASQSTAWAGEVAARRHRFILDLLDREVPTSTNPLGGPLPTAAAAHRVAEAVRATATPANVVVAALSGRLTPGMLSAAQAVYPGTIARLRAALLGGLAAHGHEGIPAATRRTIATILGQGDSGYRSAMAAVAEASSAPTPPGPSPRPTPPSGPGPLTPAQRAANPGAR